VLDAIDHPGDPVVVGEIVLAGLLHRGHEVPAIAWVTSGVIEMQREPAVAAVHRQVQLLFSPAGDRQQILHGAGDSLGLLMGVTLRPEALLHVLDERLHLYVAVWACVILHLPPGVLVYTALEVSCR
jgi:hypothetical protein